MLLDGPGILKYGDFGLSRVEGENLESVFEQFQDPGLCFNCVKFLDCSKANINV